MTKLTPANEKILRKILLNYMVPKKCRNSLEKILGEYMSLKEEEVVFAPAARWTVGTAVPGDITFFNMEPPN